MSPMLSSAISRAHERSSSSNTSRTSAKSRRGERAREGDGHLVLDRRGKQAGGRQHARMARDQHVPYAELGRKRGRVDRSGAAQRHQA